MSHFYLWLEEVVVEVGDLLSLTSEEKQERYDCHADDAPTEHPLSIRSHIFLCAFHEIQR